MSKQQTTSEGWFKPSERPPEPGFIVKKWIRNGKVTVWAGYFNGDPKMASCDEWKPLVI